jgi:hypothetical protein
MALCVEDVCKRSFCIYDDHNGPCCSHCEYRQIRFSAPETPVYTQGKGYQGVYKSPSRCSHQSKAGPYTCTPRHFICALHSIHSIQLHAPHSFFTPPTRSNFDSSNSSPTSPPKRSLHPPSKCPKPTPYPAPPPQYALHKSHPPSEAQYPTYRK